MHKKLASDLTSLAHSILQMKNKDDVFALKEKAHEVYEKLALLAYVEEYINTTPNATTTKDELIASISEAEDIAKEKLTRIEETSNNEVQTIEEQSNTTLTATIEEEDIVTPTKDVVEDEQFTILETEKYIEDLINSQAAIVENTLQEQDETPDSDTAIANTDNEIAKNEVIEQPFDALEGILFGEPSLKNEADFIENQKAPALEEETETEKLEPQLKKATTTTVETEEKEPNANQKLKLPTLEDELAGTISVDVMANLFEKVPPKRTLNDRLQNSIQIDLNDRIAFVKNLFEGDQKDFNRVISQLNTLKTEKDAKQFILRMVKPDYDWSDKEHYETRLLEIIERRFT